jgi:PhnB protein
MPLRTYLAFPGTCADALNTYAAIMGGVVTHLHHWGDDAPPGWEGKVIHGEWVVDGAVVFGCDPLPGQFEPASGTSLSWNCTDPDDARRVFDGLSEGGSVQIPFAPAPWSPGYGMCTDRFGIPWQVNVDTPDHGN